MRMAGQYYDGQTCWFPASCAHTLPGQRIVARLRERTYAASLRQEVEFVERGEGDVLSRLSVDTSIVGERFHAPPSQLSLYVHIHMLLQCHSELIRWFTLNCHVIRRSWVFRLFFHCFSHQPFPSGCYVLLVANAHSPDAGCCTSCLPWCRAFMVWLLSPVFLCFLSFSMVDT